LEHTQVKMVHIEELNARNSFSASIGYEGGMFAYCRFKNVVMLNRMKLIIESEELYTDGRQVTNIFTVNHFFLLEKLTNWFWLVRMKMCMP